MTTNVQRAKILRSLHVPGDPLILVNVWDAVSARVVAAAPARIIIDAIDLPVTVDFEKGYGATTSEVEHSIANLIAAGASGLNIEDSIGEISDGRFDVRTAADRVAAVRSASNKAGVPLVINARVDALLGGGDWAEARERGNAYLAAGADFRDLQNWVCVA